MVIYAVAVLLSACLLFLVQPLIAKMILPWFGGTSAVWSAALVFFQLCLLAGYAYAHLLTTRLGARLQLRVHGLLLLVACAAMPILPDDSWRAATAMDPAWRILLLLTVTVGLPSFLLSATSPLLQVWYLRRTGGEAPYWLFALSNAGSLIALLSFPILLEPSFGARSLAHVWSGAFVVFAVMCFYAGWISRSPTAATAPTLDASGPAPGVPRMLIWVLLSACASALLVAVSAQLSTNVAPIPLLWVVPLALYLLTFILNFSNRRFYRRGPFFVLLAIALGATAYLYASTNSNISIYYVIPAYLASLFVICMACHGELVQLRPPTRFLTRFYLLIAFGGALGGAFAALFAPLAFDTYLELPLLLIVIAELWVVLQWFRQGSARTLWLVRAVMIIGVAMLIVYLGRGEILVREQHRLVERNFYGVLRVRDDALDDELARRSLLHGTISHGYQFLNEPYRDVPGSYYAATTGVGRILEALQERGPVRVGVIGLGAGVLSSYARASDYFRLYEINPAVVRIAHEHFSFVPQARERGANIQVLLGDARVVLEEQERLRLDLIVVDAFSSDAIPAHLLTNEAVALYFQHLQPNGVLALHISNRYLDLAPVAARAAEHVRRPAVVVVNERDGMSNSSTWVLITADTTLFAAAPFENAAMEALESTPDIPAWTDEFSSVWRLLELR